jgi:hypothetical protein
MGETELRKKLKAKNLVSDSLYVLESGKMIASLHAREDDLYSGYGREDVAPDLDTEGLQFDEGFQVSLFVQWYTDKKEN